MKPIYSYERTKSTYILKSPFCAKMSEGDTSKQGNTCAALEGVGLSDSRYEKPSSLVSVKACQGKVSVSVEG